MKPKYAFAAAVFLAIATTLYVMHMPGARLSSHVSSKITSSLDRHEIYRSILFGVAALSSLAAALALRFKPKLMPVFWIVAIVAVAVGGLIPGYPRPSALPFRNVVFWAGLMAQLALCNHAAGSFRNDSNDQFPRS